MAVQKEDPNNPIVFFDIAIGNTVSSVPRNALISLLVDLSTLGLSNIIYLVFQEVGRIKFELFTNIVPKTAENFR